MIGLSRMSHQQRHQGRRVMASIMVDGTTTLSETIPLTLAPKTAKIMVSLKRPTTLKPLNWDVTGTVTVTIKAMVDGQLHICRGRATGGIRLNGAGQEGSAYSLTFTPTWGYLEGPSNPVRRLGEGSAAYHATVEIVRSSGSIETEVDITTMEADAPAVPFTNSVAFNAATDGQELNGDGVLSVSHTAAGSDRAAFAGVSGATEPTAVTSITYAGSAMTQLWDFRDAGPSLLNGGFVLAGVGTGSQTVTSTLDAGTSDHALGVISFTGVDQTTPTGNVQTVTNSGTTATVTVTGVAADDMVVDNVVTAYGGGGAPSVGANQTQRYTETMAWAGSHLAGSTQPGASGGVMSWTFDSRDYTLGAARLIAATAAGASRQGLMMMGMGR